MPIERRGSNAFPGAAMTRRTLLGSLCSVPLVGCQGSETASVRYRVIASAHVDGKPIVASTIMEVRYSRVKHSLTGAGGATRLYGEALILDLQGKGTVYILPVEHSPPGPLEQIYEGAVLSTLGVTNSIGTLTDADFEKVRTAKGRMPFRYYNSGRLPAFVAFRDEKVANTIYEINPSRMDQYFPGVRFDGLDIEIADAPVTDALAKRLPWLRARKAKTDFSRDPPGHVRPAKDRPLGYLVVEDHFYGSGSR
jgi:hypothetical protein